MFKFALKKTKSTFKIHNKIKSISDIIDKQLTSYGTRPAIRFDTGEGYEKISFNKYLSYIKTMIAFFQKENHNQQKVVATFCKNRIEWDMAALGSFYTGNIIFPLDTKTNPKELEHLLTLCPPDYIVISCAQLDRFRGIKERCNLSTKIIVADIITVFEDLEKETYQPGLAPDELSMAQIYDQFANSQISTASPRLNDPQTILGHYPTSGTTNLPKIVRISHGNIVGEVNCAMDVLNLRPNEDILNIGPYTHIATLVEFLVTKTRGFTVTYFTREPDDDDVLEGEIEKLRKNKVRIKALMAVPKFWIYLMKEVLEDMKNKPVLHDLYKHLICIEKNDQLYDLGTIEKAKLTAIRILLRNKLGGYFSYGISSSMKLDGAIVEIFGKLGITVIDIYGATECCGIISRNKLNDIIPGSCGKIIDELDFKLNDLRELPGVKQQVGELAVKGTTVAHSYIIEKQQYSPLPLDEDGFYLTGDLAHINSDRTVHLIGREKELIRWQDGTYVDPQHMSNLLVRSIFVKDAMVAHRNADDDFLSVYLFPNYKRIKKDPFWQKDIDTGIKEDAALKARLLEAIRYAESIANISPELNKKNIYILPRKLERTPTHKIKFIFELQRLSEARTI
ncbi:MAG: AMP-binding protein [Desulfobulbaceae bacterium]|nr:AMP-binding protein [Desulfobulbaceae bacterium]